MWFLFLITDKKCRNHIFHTQSTLMILIVVAKVDFSAAILAASYLLCGDYFSYNNNKLNLPPSLLHIPVPVPLVLPVCWSASRLPALWLQVSHASDKEPPPPRVASKGGLVRMVHSSPGADLLALAAANSLASFSRSYNDIVKKNDALTSQYYTVCALKNQKKVQ